MKRTSIAALAFMLAIPAAASGQQWTAEQQAVWAWEKSCWEAKTMDALTPCFHETFEGWGMGRLVPTTKMDRMPYFARNLAVTPTIFLAMKPLSIRIHGNVAIILYMATYTTKNSSTGEEVTTTEQWTDIALRQGNSWAWIADHGFAVPAGS